MAEAKTTKTTSYTIDIPTLSSCVAIGAQGQKMKIGQLWQSQTAVIIFLRHFGCIACRGHALQVWAERSKFESAGAKIVFIGNGQHTYIEKFQDELNLKGALILTDPSLMSFRAAGFRHGFFALFQPRSAFNFAKLAANGLSNQVATSEKGTNWQLGGIVVMKPDGKVAYHFVSEALGDYPPANDYAES